MSKLNGWKFYGLTSSYFILQVTQQNTCVIAKLFHTLIETSVLLSFLPWFLPSLPPSSPSFLPSFLRYRSQREEYKQLLKGSRDLVGGPRAAFSHKQGRLNWSECSSGDSHWGVVMKNTDFGARLPSESHFCYYQILCFLLTSRSPSSLIYEMETVTVLTSRGGAGLFR